MSPRATSVAFKMLLDSTLSWTVVLLAVKGLALNTDDQVNTDIDYGTFEDPSAFVRVSNDDAQRASVHV